MRRECLNAHWFMWPEEARQTIEQWRREYNEARPHSSLGYLTLMEYADKHERGEISDAGKLTLDGVQ